MTLKNTDERWGAVSQLFHWTIVVLILVMAYLGLTMGDLPNGPRKINIYALHKSIGLTILALVVLRVLWRVYAGAPAPVAGTPSWQQRIASVTHFFLYALLFAIPLSGWVLNSSAGYPLQWFKLFNLPAITGRSDSVHEAAEGAHELLFWVLVVLVLAHAGAALYHHLFQGDATLRRMLPGRRAAVAAPAAASPLPPSPTPQDSSDENP
ncbi:cytochrome b [Pseudoxanthomonas sp. LjRoot143]|uniref:cytochrome b n=1 Tax=Pseudoxanthomonas sp. LjRoot143 TaxID=3342266 RepID=UPI003ECCA8ED